MALQDSRTAGRVVVFARLAIIGLTWAFAKSAQPSDAVSDYLAFKITRRKLRVRTGVTDVG